MRKLLNALTFIAAIAMAAACEEAPPAASLAQDATDTAISSTDAATDSVASSDTSSGTDAAKDTAKAETTPPACNPIKNTGCADPATHCGYDESDVIACIPNGKAAIAEECGSVGCAVGTCIQNQAGTSLCAPFCTLPTHCPSGDCNGVEGKKWKTCDVAKYVPCDLFAQNCTDKTLACYDGPGGFVCLKKGAGVNGEACQSSNDCAPGFACAGAAALGKGLCRPLCAVGGGAPACQSVEANCTPVAGSKKFGFCDGEET